MVRAADDLTGPLRDLSGQGVTVALTGSSSLWRDFNAANLARYRAVVFLDNKGDLLSAAQETALQGYIQAGLDEGARLVLGGTERPRDRGWYVQPTLFADATNDMRIAREEIFGPVLTVLKYSDEREAVRIANDSDYGLAGAVFTADPDRGHTVAAQIRAGSFGVNEGYIMDPLAPYGGMKASGYGRELGREGLEGYLVSQSLWRGVARGRVPQQGSRDRDDRAGEGTYRSRRADDGQEACGIAVR